VTTHTTRPAVSSAGYSFENKHGADIMDVSRLIRWLQSLENTTVRGRIVVDTDLHLEADFSGHVIVTLATPDGRTLVDRVADNSDGTHECVWHFRDCRTILDDTPQWEYWDEFADRSLSDLE
jgi:hypothetical protein